MQGKTTPKQSTTLILNVFFLYGETVNAEHSNTGKLTPILHAISKISD